MRISDWSSDVCSSDLAHGAAVGADRGIGHDITGVAGRAGQDHGALLNTVSRMVASAASRLALYAARQACERQRMCVEGHSHCGPEAEIGRAAGRDRVGQYV